MTQERRLILVGQIGGGFGVRGEVRVTAFTADPLALTAYGPLLRADGSVALTLTSTRPDKNGVVGRAKEVATKEQADALRGLKLYVPRDRFPEPEEDEFYLADLIGLEVRDIAGAIWLTISPKLGSRNAPLSRWVAEVGREHKVPTLFVFGKNDAKGDNLSLTLYKSINPRGEKNKDLKRVVRARMKKTGESYTTARSHVVKKQAAPDYAATAGMSDDAVHKKTGGDWAHWVKVLDKAKATSMPHREIAMHVHERYEIPGWWAQTVTVGYERIKGLRDVGQRRDGTYDANKSKTFAAPIADLYRAFSDSDARALWLPGVELTVRTATPEKSMRVTWPDSTSVEAYFTAKGERKSQVAIQHRKLGSKDDIETVKAYWAERLTALAEMLASSGSS